MKLQCVRFGPNTQQHCLGMSGVISAAEDDAEVTANDAFVTVCNDNGA